MPVSDADEAATLGSMGVLPPTLHRGERVRPVNRCDCGYIVVAPGYHDERHAHTDMVREGFA